MLLRELSDVHLEICPYFVPKMARDSETTLLLPGDIATAHSLKGETLQFFAAVSRQFKHVVWVPGNHEFYRSHLTDGVKKIRQWLANNNFDNVHFLDCESVVLDGVAFIGATLWTDVKKGDPLAKYFVENGLNDYVVIRTENYRKLKVNDTIRLHEVHKNFIFSEVAKYKAEGLKTVVLSHHAPSELSVHQNFRGHDLNPAYFSNLEDLILDNGPDLWWHGHMHNSFNYELGNTTIRCNPRGYSKVWNKNMFLKLIDSVEGNGPLLTHEEFDDIFNPENHAFDPFLRVEI